MGLGGESEAYFHGPVSAEVTWYVQSICLLIGFLFSQWNAVEFIFLLVI